MRVTYKPFVSLRRQRKDKTFGVSIRIGYKSKYAFVETEYSASKTDLKGSTLKEGKLNDKCNAIISEYRIITDALSESDFYDVSQVLEYIKHKQGNDEGVDFMLYLKNYVTKLEDSKSPSREIYSATYNHFRTFLKKDILLSTHFTSRLLQSFEDYLIEKGVGSHGLQSYMSKLRAVFNRMDSDFEEIGYVFRNPFKKYKVPTAVNKPTIALTREQLVEIRDIELEEGSQAEYIRSAFMISLLTLGTNATDLYDMEHPRKGRIEYCRNKTKNKRISDQAFISIKIEPELIPFILKVENKGDLLFSFTETYSTRKNFNTCISRGVKEIADTINAKYLEIDKEKYSKEKFIQYFDFYDARRTVASVMRNALGISKDDVALCLNHKDKDHVATDYYIEKDFSILDRCNRKFIDWLYNIESDK